MISARNRSHAIAPRPSQTVLYEDRNGSTASVRLIDVYESTAVVPTCRPRNATASSEMLRCRPIVRKRGQVTPANRPAVRMPSTTAAVSSRSVTRPVARVAYHSPGPPPRRRAGRLVGGELIDHLAPPAAGRRLAREGDVTAQVDQYPAAGGGRGPGRGPVGGQRLGGRAEIQQNARGEPDGLPLGVELHQPPARRGRGRPGPRAGGGAGLGKIPGIAPRDQIPAAGRIHG